MTRFHTSDTHMGHLRISEYAGRPWLGQDISAMNEALIAAWNAVVGFEDTVIHYGDLALGDLEKSLAACKRLNGDKYLVPGNHDRVFCRDKRADQFRARYEDAGFTILDEQITLDLDDARTGTTLRALGCHFPYAGDSHGSDRYADLRPADHGMPLVHGHVHQAFFTGTSPAGTPMINVGVDAPGVNFTPLTDQQVIDLLLGRTTTV